MIKRTEGKEMPDKEPETEKAGGDPIASPRPRRRIAQKLLLLYFIPVAVLILAGVVTPLVLWNVFGATIRQHEAAMAFTAQTVALKKEVTDYETQVRTVILSRNRPGRETTSRIQDERLMIFRLTLDMGDYLEQTRDDEMLKALRTARERFQLWYRYILDREPEPRPGRLNRFSVPAMTPEFRANFARVTFITVQNDLTNLTQLAERRQIALQAPARTAALMRQVIAFTIPAIAFLLSALIGRSIALSITKPLEALTRATEALERGVLPVGMPGWEENLSRPNDEIGDLQQSFYRMAQTIGQREAMLRVQNETLGALNQRIEAVLNSTNDAILMLDRAGAFSVVNQRFTELFGIEADVLLDQTFVQAAPLLLSRFKKRQEVRERLERLLFDPEAVCEESFEVLEPTPRILRLYSAPVRQEMIETGTRSVAPDTDPVLGRIFVFRDVTHETMVDRMKTEFVSTVSHELRTPLTAIKGYVDLIVSGQTGALTPVQSEFLTMVQGSTRRLTSMINDLLDISRIESGRMEIRQESVDYVPLVRDVVRMMQGEADTHKVTLSVVVPEEGKFPLVQGDADRISQVLINFLSNAIKYTPAGGEVRVIVRYEGDFVVTCVADTGIGISPDDQARLFQKFFRADNSSTRETGGTGLGLAITKAILEKLNGSVWVESEIGKGSQFWFTLPTAEGEIVPTDLTETHHRLILNIDGDVALLHRLGHELRHQGFVTSNAATPQEALRRAKGLRPDIITLDLLNPGLDGIELLRTLRQQPTLRHIPIVLMSPYYLNSRLELRDSFAFLPRRASEPDAAPQVNGEANHRVDTAVLNDLLRRALSQQKSRRETVLVLGESGLIAAVYSALSPFGQGVRLMTATNLTEATTRVSESLPDIVVLDTALTPDTTGAKFVARLKQQRYGLRTPIIAVVDADLLEGNITVLPVFGNGALPVHRLGPSLRQVLRERNADEQVLRERNADEQVLRERNADEQVLRERNADEAEKSTLLRPNVSLAQENRTFGPTLK